MNRIRVISMLREMKTILDILKPRGLSLAVFD